MARENRHPLAPEVGEGHHLPVGAGHLPPALGKSLAIEQGGGVAMMTIGDDRPLLTHELRQPQGCGRVPHRVQPMNLPGGSLDLDDGL